MFINNSFKFYEFMNTKRSIFLENVHKLDFQVVVRLFGKEVQLWIVKLSWLF